MVKVKKTNVITAKGKKPKDKVAKNVSKVKKYTSTKKAKNEIIGRKKIKQKPMKKPKKMPRISDSNHSKSENVVTLKKKPNKLHEARKEVDDVEEADEESVMSDVSFEAMDPEETDAQGSTYWDDEPVEPDDASSGDDFEDHKKALERLKETDPEFYSYLQENDKKLLNFNLSDDDDDDGDKAEDDEELHRPTEQLDVASDESDFEPDGEKVTNKRLVTLKLLKQWQNDVQSDKSNKTIACIIRAFHAALRRVSSEEGEEPSYYKVDGSSVFNGVIQLCVLELGPAIRKFLGLKSGSRQPPHKCKRFVKVKTLLKGYFTDLLKLLGGVTSPNILKVLLKHLHYMSTLIVSYQHTTKLLLKKLVHLWGTADESVRVVAFLCILRITHNQQQSLLESVLRMMYMTYIKNSKFVSVNTLPNINFMRRSLVEMYTLDLSASYSHVFLYIRQLAINLRNAIIVNKKEKLQAVYNWQFINSLRVWASLLATTHNKPQLQPMVYPFVQICLGTIKLIPTAQYYPLRFHIVQMLIDLSRDTGVFIPVLPFILEVLMGYDFNKKHLKVSMKPLNLTCLLRLSKSQMSENGFKDAIIDAVYAQLLEYTASQSQSIAFPDMVLFCKLQIKAFTKKCNISNYQRKMSQILEKIDQNMQFIEQERKNVSCTLTDFKQISAWETGVRNKGTPLNTFYENWNKVRTIKKRKEVTDNEQLGDYNLPALKKSKKARRETEKEVVLFPSDSEDEDEIGFGGKKEDKPKRGKRGGKNIKKKIVHKNVDVNVNGDDLVEDLKMSDW